MRTIKLLLYLAVIVLAADVYAVDDIAITLSRSEKKLLSDGEVIVREVPDDKTKGKTIEAIGLIQATVDEVYRVLVDFEKYHTFKPHVSSVEILECDDNHAILDYTLTLPLGKRKRYRLSKNFENNGSQAVMKWEKADWPGLKRSETIDDTVGYWLVKNYPDKKGYVIAVYHVFTDPGPIPVGLGWIADILSKNSVPKVVVATREQVYKVNNK